MPCDFCTQRNECDAREDSIQVLQLEHCQEAGEPSWLSDEDLPPIASGKVEVNCERSGKAPAVPKKVMKRGKKEKQAKPAARKQMKKIIICGDCKEEKQLHSYGLCGHCYWIRRKAGTLPEPKVRKPKVSDVKPTTYLATVTVDKINDMISKPLPDPQLSESFRRGPSSAQLAERFNTNNAIHLTFSDQESDQQLLASIRQSAILHRRTPDQEILWIVQCALDQRAEFLKENTGS